MRELPKKHDEMAYRRIEFMPKGVDVEHAKKWVGLAGANAVGRVSPENREAVRAYFSAMAELIDGKRAKPPELPDLDGNDMLSLLGSHDIFVRNAFGEKGWRRDKAVVRFDLDKNDVKKVSEVLERFRHHMATEIPASGSDAKYADEFVAGQEKLFRKYALELEEVGVRTDDALAFLHSLAAEEELLVKKPDLRELAKRFHDYEKEAAFRKEEGAKATYTEPETLKRVKVEADERRARAKRLERLFKA